MKIINENMRIMKRCIAENIKDAVSEDDLISRSIDNAKLMYGTAFTRKNIIFAIESIKYERSRKIARKV